MPITKQEIKTLARLARLEFSDERCEEFAPEFDEIISFANLINEEVEGDTETIREVSSRAVALNDLRGNEVEESLPAEKIVSCVQSENGYFPVKRVVK